MAPGKATIPSPAHKPTDIRFFSDADAYSRIPFCLYKQWGSDRLGNIGGLPESEGPPSINWPDLVQIKPQSSTVRHRAGEDRVVPAAQVELPK